MHVQDLSYDGGRHLVEGTEATIPAQLVLIAKGFTGANPAVFEAFDVSLPSAVVHTACAKPTQRTTSLPSSLRVMHALVRRSW